MEITAEVQALFPQATEGIELIEFTQIIFPLDFS